MNGDLLGDDIEAAVVTSLSLEIRGGVSFEHWRAIGVRLGRANSRIQWYIGDWWIYGEDRYDSRRYEVLDEFGVHYHTCENYAVVSRAFDGSRRRESLSFSHHEVVASLPPGEQDKLLDWCLEGAEANGRPRSRGELRQEVKQREWTGRQITIQVHNVSQPVSQPIRLVALRPVQHTNQPIALNTSKVGNSTPPELAALQFEPPPSVQINRLKIAIEAVRALPTEDLEQFRAWFDAYRPG
jgi:hypothetical protein